MNIARTILKLEFYQSKSHVTNTEETKMKWKPKKTTTTTKERM